MDTESNHNAVQLALARYLVLRRPAPGQRPNHHPNNYTDSVR